MCSLHVAQEAAHPEALHSITDAGERLRLFRINFQHSGIKLADCALVGLLQWDPSPRMETWTLQHMCHV